MKLARDEIYLRMLGDMLQQQNITGEILLAERAILFLDIYQREVSKDINAYFSPGEALREAARILAEQEGLPLHWFLQTIERSFPGRTPSDSAIYPGLLSSLLTALHDCPRIYAFWIATPLTLGVEALPVEHRPVMHNILMRHGFIGEDDWLYMKGPILTDHLSIDRHIEVERIESGWKLFILEGNERIAEAEIGLGRDQIGVLWWVDCWSTKIWCNCYRLENRTDIIATTSA